MGQSRTIAVPLLSAARILAAVAFTAQAEPLAITHVNVVDVASGRVISDTTVTVEGSAIVSVGAKAPASARLVDGHGKFVIPGLWDMHAHMQMVGEPWLQLYVANGVTCIRDMGSDLDLILNMREATSSGRVLGPRIFAAGPILDDAPGDWPFRMRVKTAEDGKAAVRLLKQRGVDLIKVHDHTPRAAFFAIAEEARRQNLRLAGHVPLAVSIEEAIEAGQGDIEHLSNLQLWDGCSGDDEYRPEACRPFFEMLARRGIWQTPTLFFWSEVATVGTAASKINPDRMAYASKSLRAFWAGNQKLISADVARKLRAGADIGAVVTKDMAKAGVPILSGCDGMIADSCVNDELEAFVRGGMSPAAALQTATINPAKYFNLEEALGRIAPGYQANLVLLDGNPLTDIKNVRRVWAVILGGRLLERRDLDNLIGQVKRAVSEASDSRRQVSTAR